MPKKLQPRISLYRSIVLSCCWCLAALPALAKGDASPSTIKVDQTSISVSEAAGVANVVVERSQGEDGAVTVNYATVDGSAQAGSDYVAVSGQLSWADGDGTNRVVHITLLDDGVAEGIETFVLQLSGVTGNAQLDPTRSSTEVRIGASQGGSDDPPGDDSPGDDSPGDDGPGDDSPGDDNPGDDSPGDGGSGGSAGVLKFDQRSFATLEGAGMAVITVERSHGEDGAVSVDYTTLDGTATAPEDYQTVSGTLNWGNGDESVRSFMVPVVSDNANEGTETVLLELSGATGGATIDAVRGSAVLSILDDDSGVPPAGGDDGGGSAGTFKFSESSFQVTEKGVEAVIVVERSGGEAGAVTVDYGTVEESATEGVDYAATFGTLSWGAGDERRRTFRVPVFDDPTQEGTETLGLVLSNPTGGATLDALRSEATLSILDDDSASASACTPSATTLCLQGGRFEASVVFRTANGSSGRAQAVQLSQSSGLFSFFNADNVEMLLKTLDGCSIKGLEAYWVFYAALTNVDFTLTVTDRQTGLAKEYSNLLGQAALPVQDLSTFKGCK